MSAPSPFQIRKSRLEGREGFEPSTPGFAASRSLVQARGAVHYPAYSLQIPCLKGSREHHDGDMVSVDVVSGWDGMVRAEAVTP